MRCLVLCVFMLLLNVAWSQQVKFRKSESLELKESVEKFDFENRNMLIRHTNQSKPSSIKQLLFNRSPINLANNEKLVHVNKDGAVYKLKFTTKSDNVGSDRVLVKMKNNAEESHANFSMDDNVEPIDEAGYFISSDFSHGNATGYVFFSPQLDILNVVRPYDFFNCTDYGYSTDLVCLYCQEKTSSEKFKLSLLDHTGNLIKEKEFAREKYNSADIKIINDRIVLLLNSTLDGSSRVFCLDTELNIVWRKDTTERVDLELGSPNFLLIFSNEKMECFDMINGNKIWSKKVTSLSNQIGGLWILQLDFVLGYKCIAVIQGKYNDKTQTYTLGILSLLNVSDGSEIYSEKIAESFTESEIINQEHGFLVVLNSRILRYEPEK